ncbi:hypothetical protein GMES_1818 [Paraglaciecola mesophila KMM 241]|uniref:Uncharacterized protein n=1 Tax=Paraglaciecola mesophila KMM 241 TaxID=1128912 RepID=K6XU12_9ALTE|nr:hypothetical protein GMES_1818 [Paraglaciecola mesophila KMM 241]
MKEPSTVITTFMLSIFTTNLPALINLNNFRMLSFLDKKK